MKIERKHKCQHCNKEFEWFYIVPRRIGSCLKAETVPKNKAGLYSVIKLVEKNNYKMPLKATVYCPKCNRLNSIEIEYEK